MKIYRTPSLSRDFSIFCSIVVMVVTLASGWFGWRTYKTQTDHITRDLKSQTDRMEDTFQDILEYTEHLMSYIARQITLHSHNGHDLKYISTVLNSYRLIEKDVLAWNTFSWVDASHHVRVSSALGVLYPPYHSLAKRDYMPRTVLQPGKIQTGNPNYGILTRQWSVTLGYGVRNQSGEYLGSVVTGLIMDSLESKFNSVINVNGINFHILDSDYKTVAQTPGPTRTLPRVVVEALEEKEKENQMSGLLSTSLPFHHDNGFVYYRTFPNHPYKFILSYDKRMSDQRIWHTMLSYLYEFTAVGCLVIMLLYVFRQRIILPIVALSDVAVGISKGEEVEALKKIPSHSPIEIYNLTEQLQKIVRYTHELRDTQARLQNANTLTRSALGYMAHELKTPLNLIIGFSELLLSEVYEPLTGKTKEYLQLVYDAGQHQHKLINAFLKTAEYNKGEAVIERSEVDVMALIQYQILMASNLSKEIDVTLELKSKTTHLPTMMLDEIKMGQAFQNFITNGIKYNTRAGKLTITLSVYEDEDGKEMLLVSFEDTGIGIAAEKYDAVFERFTRLAMGAAPTVDGNGLGLPFAKEVVELHGGSITVSSKVGEGTIFMVRLPILRRP